MKFTTPLGLLATAAALGATLQLLAPAGQASALLGADAMNVDLVHSSVTFRCQHLGVSWAQGRFNQFEGTFDVDPENLAESTVSFGIAAESVDTNNSDRDDHLRGPDFFTVKQFPRIEFASETIDSSGDDTYTVSGTVSWMGKEVALETEIQALGENEFRGKQVRGYTTEFTLKRSDFGMDYGIEPGILGDEVFVRMDVEAN